MTASLMKPIAHSKRKQAEHRFDGGVTCEHDIRPNGIRLDRVGSCEFSGIPNRESYMEIPLNSRGAREQRETYLDLRGCCPRSRTRSFPPSAGLGQKDPSECYNVRRAIISMNAAGSFISAFARVRSR
jgi:hypothetical protein